jgi:hypothetical protein
MVRPAMSRGSYYAGLSFPLIRPPKHDGGTLDPSPTEAVSKPIFYSPQATKS